MNIIINQILVTIKLFNTIVTFFILLGSVMSFFYKWIKHIFRSKNNKNNKIRTN